ncbi:MAG: hypothetical protein WCJ56_00425 [bacterium]
MKKLGKTLLILAAIVILLLIGSIAGRILLWLAFLALRISLGVIVVLAIWAIVVLIKLVDWRHIK